MVETDDYPSPRVIAFRRRIIIRLYDACHYSVIFVRRVGVAVWGSSGQ